MKYKILGGSNTKFSEIGLGTWKFNPNLEEASKTAKYMFENGVNFLDTAEMYQNESRLGIMLKEMKIEDEPFIATKVSPNNLHYNDIIRSCNESLSKLGVKQITLYQIHWPNHRINIRETINAMEHLVEEGKIRYIGVSNFDQKELEEALSYLKSYKIVSNQVEYSVAFNEIENSGLMDFCNKNKISIIAYSPIGRGMVENYKYLYNELHEIGIKYNATALQVALKYIISNKNVIAIPKVSSIEHAKEILGTEKFDISKSDINRIKDIADKIKKPLAGKILNKILKANGCWSGIMERHERLRMERD